MKKILVTGGAGYLGSVLCHKLIDKGYSIRCFDRLYFGDGSVKDLSSTGRFELIKGNIVNLKDFPELLDDIDSVIHLAGLANDPTAELDTELTRITNQYASVELAKEAKKKGISKFIFASSCSVYGKGLSEEITEESPLNPVSVYAESKVLAEQEIALLKDEKFHPVFLRQATLFGRSYRMRFDLAINLMVVHALTKKKIFVWGGGEQWRPFLHVDDAAEAFLACLEAETKTVSGKVFNVGDSKVNYKIIDLANFVKDRIKGTELEIVPDTPDKRSYKVRFDKIGKSLGWYPKIKVEDGIKELSDYLLEGKIKDFDSPEFYNIKTIMSFIEKPAIEGGDPVRTEFLPFSLPLIGKEEEEEVLDTLRSGWLTTGPKTKKLEDEFSGYLGAKHSICVSSCTAALHLALVALGIKKGDEVITSPITWPATANVIVHTGAVPVFADVERDTLNIDPAKIEKKITKKTKAIIPVHMAGQPCDMDKISRIAKKHGLFVIEDAAHAIGAEYNGSKIGVVSDMTCFSFYPIKNMTTIEGGLITTNNDGWAENMRVNSLHGIDKDAWKRYTNTEFKHHEVVYPGFKYNMSDIQASMGLAQLRKLDGFIGRRKEITSIYNDSFRSFEEIILPVSKGNIKHAHHLYVIILDTDRLKVGRDKIIQTLNKENIGTGLHFRSLHVQEYYKKTFAYKPEDLPEAAFLSDRIISLPLYPKMDQYDVDSVIRAVRKAIIYYKAA
ncbi:MAG: aminotransferase class I/II-fold pyridoxal phosphate-dependent enzyme [Candidatus Omnitrophota bacterium]